MLKALKEWFGFAVKKAATIEGKEESKLANCLRTLADVPPGLSLNDKIIVVCKGAQLTLRKDGALPDTLKEGEVCWLLPGGDVRLPIVFHYEAREVRAVVVLRFEGDRNFALYVANLLATGKDGITEFDLALFVAGQWSELLAIQRVTLEQLSANKPELVARFRTHLSLLLQENGFRCVGIESIEVQTPQVQAAKPEALPKDPLPNIAVQELDAAIKQATTETGWEQLLDQLDDAGFAPRESDAETLETLGTDYRNRKVSAEDVALQIRRMIERNNLEVGLISERVARWNAMEVKLRLLDSLDGKPEEYLLTAAKSLEKPEKVPSTWYMLRRHKVDEKLQKYLKTQSKALTDLLESAMKRQSALENRAKLASSQQTLKRIADKLTMTPDLQNNLRGRQRNIDELVAAVRRSVTTMQLSDGLLRSLASEDYPKEQYLATVADLEATLMTLEREIDDRKNVYGV